MHAGWHRHPARRLREPRQGGSMLPLVLLLALLLGFVAPASADYPERPLTIVVAYPAGGMVDIVARPMAESMKKTFTKGVAVLNRPGGGGSVGMAEVAQAKPDGYTVIIAPNSTRSEEHTSELQSLR